jgi:hypothetical protein
LEVTPKWGESSTEIGNISSGEAGVDNSLGIKTLRKEYTWMGYGTHKETWQN